PSDRTGVTEWTESRNWTESTETYEAKRSALAFQREPARRAPRGRSLSDSVLRRPRRTLKWVLAEMADRDLVWRRTDAVGLAVFVLLSQQRRRPTPRSRPLPLFAVLLVAVMAGVAFVELATQLDSPAHDVGGRPVGGRREHE